MSIAAVEAAIARVAADAVAQFGWTHLAVTATTAADGRTVVLHGTIVAPRLLARVRGLVDPSIVLDTAAVTVLSSGVFAAVPGDAVPLWRRPIAADAGDDPWATELEAADGPLERLASFAGAELVRALDGTVGWIRGGLGPPCPRPLLAARAVDCAAIRAALPRWIGVPYRLGGSRVSGVDCSALVQRLLGLAGARVPRHSADQLAIDPRDGAGPDVLGTIVAVWSHDEAPCHVALALGDATLVHASRSRGRVVVEPRAALLARAGRIAHVEVAAIEALQRRAAGMTDLLAALRGGPSRGG